MSSLQLLLGVIVKLHHLCAQWELKEINKYKLTMTLWQANAITTEWRVLFTKNQIAWN